MTGEFRGVAITTTNAIPSTAGTPIPIQMPSDIVAGDILIVCGEGYNLNVTDPPAGWSQALNNFDLKIATGSEAGATLNWVSRDTTSLDPFATSPNPRTAVFGAFCYRFPVTPSGGALGPNGWFHSFGAARFVPPGGNPSFYTPMAMSDFYGTAYPGAVTNVSEFRFLMASAQAGSTASGPHLIADSITWSGDLLTDRTGIQSIADAGDPDGLDDDVSRSWADQFYLTNVANSNPHTDVVVAGGAGVGFYLNGFSILFPTVPLVAYWGINATTPA